MSPVGKIEIYQGKKLIFKGILNSNKINNIEIDNNNSSNELNDEYKIREIFILMPKNLVFLQSIRKKFKIYFKKDSIK